MTKGFVALLLGSSALVFAAGWFMAAPSAAPSTAAAPAPAQSSVYYAGCREARAAGATPLHVGEPGYREGMDGDGDGVACESY